MTAADRADPGRLFGIEWKFWDDRFVTVDGIRTRYWDTGSGPRTLVLVHGFTGCVENWAWNILPLEAHARVIALDLPGFGQTDKPNVDYDYPFFVGFLRRFLDQLGVGRVSLFGHSMGGFVATLFLTRFPERVDQLVLISPAAGRKCWLGLRLMSLPLLGERLAKPATTTDQIRAGVRINLQHEVNWPEFLLERYLGYLQAPGYSRACLSFIRRTTNLFGANGRFRRWFDDCSQQFKNLPQPVLLVWGRQDQVLPFASHRFFDDLPGLEFWPVDDCGHGAHFEYPQEFNHRVADFLGFATAGDQAV